MRCFTLLIGGVLTVAALPAAAQQPTPTAVPSAIPRTADATTARAAMPPRTKTPSVLAGTPEHAFSTIQGNALDAINHVLPNRPMRLRDARNGGVVDAQFTDLSGLFIFRGVDPGSYVVELVSVEHNTVLAASDVVNINAGEAATTIVKLPLRVPAGLFGHKAAAALAVTSAAAATGVLTQTPTAPVSCEQLPCTP